MKRPSPWTRILFLLSALVAVAGLAYANYQFALQAPGGNDFLARWMGARAWVLEGISPYDPQVSLRTQEVIYGRPADPAAGEDVAHFVYPLPSMIFFAPFAALPFTVARALWMTLLELSLLGLGFLSLRIAGWMPRRPTLTIFLFFSVFWYPGFRDVILGQFAAIEALLLAGALYAIQRRQDGLAGVLLALSISKPNVAFLIIPFALLWGLSQRRWSLIAATLGGVGFLMGLSLLLLPQWPLQWIWQVLSYPSYTATKPAIGVIADMFPARAVWIQGGLSLMLLAYLLYEWALSWGKGMRRFQWVAAMTLLITNLIVPRTATTNYLVFLPGLTMILSVLVDRWKVAGELAAVGLMLSLLVGLWGLFLATVEGNLESPLMYLPTPAVLLLGLWWIRWWYVRSPRLLLEGE